MITKTLSKSIDFEVIPDLDLTYYLYDAPAEDSSVYSASTGLYENAGSFSQEIIVGTKDNSDFSMRNNYGSDDKAAIKTGKSLVYQIKIPVDETGYYSLAFTPEFIKKVNGSYTRTQRNNSDPYIEQDFYTVSYLYAVGCEVLNSEDDANLDFPPLDSNVAPTPLSLENSIFGNDEYYKKANYLAESSFQWKTLCISRSEDVKLTFKATEDDVEHGYVIWAWELTGLRGNSSYMLNCTSISVKKIMELNGSTKNRTSSSEPYFMLPQTLVTNNQVKIYGQIHPDDEGQTPGYTTSSDKAVNGKGDTERRGSNTPGKTEYSGGRGTYVTEATTNSLALRAETLTSGVYVDPNKSEENKNTWYKDNPVSIQIPIKNVKYNTTYKVTFDFSVARQGLADPVRGDSSNYTASITQSLKRYQNTRNIVSATVGKNMWDYADFSNIFRPNIENSNLSDLNTIKNDLNGTMFYSYLNSFTSGAANDASVEIMTDAYGNHFNVSRLARNDHQAALNQITYNHKADQGKPLAQYNHVTSLYSFFNDSSKRNYPDMTTVKSVNDTYSIEYFNPNLEESFTDIKTGTAEYEMLDGIGSTMMRNWLNAVQHTETNGQTAINWITFYNTTFSFNISEQNGVDINNLYWIWAIDALYYESFYNIRIDNLRIEEVVQYSSTLDNPDGIKIANTVVGLANMNSYGQNCEGTDIGLFNNFRGWNGTGQNYVVRGYDRNTYTTTGNIYAPIVDAKTVAATPGGGLGATDYKIYLSGAAVCKGGIDKYVWSADGGITWYDMTFSGGNATSSILTTAEKGVDQRTRAQSNSTLEPLEPTAEHIKTHEKDSNGNPVATCDRCATYPNLPGDSKAYVDFVTFGSGDALNSNFKATGTGSAKTWKLEADISAYKGQSDLDIIIAAVPASNPSLRCEIVRIINYNAANTYVSQIKAIKSDIWSGYDNSRLTVDATRLSVTNGTSGNGNIYSGGNYYEHYYPVHDTGVMYHYDISNHAEKASSGKIDYANLQTTYSDIPIKKELKVVGGIDCLDGVYEYAYSVDKGRTWTKISNRTSSYDLAYHPNNLPSTTGSEKFTEYEKLLFKWTTRDTQMDDRYFTNANGDFYHNSGARLYIDLSAYEGKVIDVIVAAKPNFQGGDNSSIKADVYLPVARIDNVAVYGAEGTFYTRVHNVTLDRVNDTNISVSTNELTGDDGAVLNDVEGNYFTGRTEWGGIVATAQQAYTIFEPQNVNVRNMRMFNQEENLVLSAGKVTIDGYIMCKGGVNRYKYSLDGGETWTIIDDLGSNIPADSTSPDIKMFSYAKRSDNGFDLAVDGRNGDFCCTGIPGASEADTIKHALEFDLPAMPTGTVKNLLVVAESNNENNEPSGKLFPVLHLRVKFYNVDSNATQYGYFRGVTNSNGTRNNAAGYIHTGEAYTFTATSTSEVFNRLTLPVSQVGTHNLIFNLTLNYDSANGAAASKDIACTILSENKKGGTLFSNVYDEPIRRDHENVKLAWNVVGGAKTEYTLTFEVDEADVKRGYVIWDWDLRMLPVGSTYHFRIENRVVNKA